MERSQWLVDQGSFMKDVVSAWALKEPEDSVPGDGKSKTKGTEIGRPGASLRNDDHSRWTSIGYKGRIGPSWMACDVRTKTCT